MSATNLQLNTVNCAFASATITKVTNFAPHIGGQLISFSGDDDRYPTVIANSMNNPSISITTGNIGYFQALAPGTVGVFTATMQDALKQTGGSLVWTTNYAVFQDYTPSQPHSNFGSCTATWLVYSADGQTPPLTFSKS